MCLRNVLDPNCLWREIVRVYVDNNTRERKTSVKGLRENSSWSGREVDVGGGGRGRYSNTCMYVLNLRASFLTSEEE